MRMRMCGLPLREIRELPAREVPFDPSARDLCEKNRCGFYGACWVCPPDCGEIGDLIARARSFDRALVFSAAYQIEDAFDIEGMAAAARAFNGLALLVRERTELPASDCLLLGAGACGVCDRCTRRDGLPCRRPRQAIPSLESHGVLVSALVAKTGMRYDNGRNTVTYFGMLFMK